MLRFEGLSKSFRTQSGRKTIVDSLTMDLPTGKSLALLGRNGAGKSTLMQLIAGNIRPDAGRIIRTGTVSWPVGYGGALHNNLTGAQNTRFLARVYGIDSDDLCEFVQDFAELGAHFRMPVRTYSSGMRARLTFGISMGLAFDIYLVDEVTGAGDAAFRAKSKRMFQDRMAHASAIMVSHNLPELREMCDAALVLEEGRITYFDDLDAAIARHKANLS